MFIPRNFDRTENDDFAINVQPRIGDDEGATPVYSDNGKVIGWKIAAMYE